MTNNPITADELFDKLPEKEFVIADCFDRIREYSPYIKFPTAKYELWEILNAWSILLSSRRVKIIESGIAKKIKDEN